MSVVVTLIALLTEAAIGYPERVVRAMGHPVTWIGALIAWLDRHLNREDQSGATRRLAGFVALAVIILVSAGVALALERGFAGLPFGFLVVALLAGATQPASACRAGRRRA
jgi:adenosylcobinamide-phosphate synthase